MVLFDHGHKPEGFRPLVKPVHSLALLGAAGTVHGFTLALTVAALLLVATAALTGTLMPGARRAHAPSAGHGRPAKNGKR